MAQTETAQELQKSRTISERTSEVNSEVRELTSLVSTAQNSDETIQNTRKEIASNPEQSAQIKSEIASKKQEYLHEMSLSQARLLQSIFTHVSKNPLISKAELIAKIKDSEDITHPKLTQQLINTIDQITKDIEDFKVNVINDIEISQAKCRELFQQLISTKARINKSEHEIEMLTATKMKMQITSFGVVLFVSDPQAFALIDPRSNVGGFFQKSQKFEYGRQSDNTYSSSIVIPLVAVKGESIRIFEHEVGHSVANMLKQMLLGIKEKHDPNEEPETWTEQGVRTPKTKIVDIIWGNSIDLDSAKKAARALDETNHRTVLTNAVADRARQEPDNEKSVAFVQEVENDKAKNKKIVMEYALQCAKNELIAEMSAKDGDVIWHLGNLKDQTGLYDYFKDHLKINPNTELYKMLWREYTAKLNSYTVTAFKLQNINQDTSQHNIWQKRIPLLRYVLLVNPIQNWESQLDRLGYNKELELFSTFKKKLRNTIESINKLNWSGFTRMTAIYGMYKYSRFEHTVTMILNQLEINIATSCDHSTIPLINKAQNDLEQLISDFEKTEAGKLLSEFIKTEDTIAEITITIEKNSRKVEDFEDLYAYLRTQLEKMSTYEISTELVNETFSESRERLRPKLEAVLQLKELVNYILSLQEYVNSIHIRFAEKITFNEPAASFREDRIFKLMERFNEHRQIKSTFIDSLPETFDSADIIQKIDKYVADYAEYVDTMKPIDSR